MAKLALAKRSAPKSSPRRPSPALAKANARLASMRSKRRESKSVSMLASLGILGAAAGMGYAQANSKLPTTILGFNAPLVVGVGLSAVPYFVSGTVGRVASIGGLAALAVGGAQIGAGAPVMAGDWA